jgi:probable F420-dependent oxidoreductase
LKISVDFPSVALREGPAKLIELARAIETIGYDDLAMFDHVVMGYPTDTRPAPRYPSKMPVLETLTTLGFLAAATQRIGLSTEVLVLPQRQAVLVAKQVSTLDTLSGGRVRLGVGVGWQQVEFDALGEDFSTRGRVMDESIRLLRACWADERIDATGRRFHADVIAMEPKPPQGGRLPIWVGGGSPAALRRVGTLGDGWMATLADEASDAPVAIAEIRRHAADAGRDPMSIDLQAMLAPPPQDEDGKTFYQDHDRVARRAVKIREMGFTWMAINATAIFSAGARTVDAMINELGKVHDRLRQEVE